jgi:hypothetical protein
VPHFTGILTCLEFCRLSPGVQSRKVSQNWGSVQNTEITFLDRGQDIVASKVRQGIFPDIVPGVALDMIYSLDLARYAAEAALDLPASALNQSVDIRCNVSATGPMVAAAVQNAPPNPAQLRG